MEIFGNDWILGDFKASNFGLMLLSFSYSGESEDELGFRMSTMEEYIGNNPVPVYLGDKYEDKLRPKVTLCKNMHFFPQKDYYFSQKECRWILRKLTGIRGYQWMQVINDDDMDDICFKAKIVNVSYQRISGNVAGIVLDLECDSFYGYSTEFNININAKANTPFYIFNNTDDVTNYVLPLTTITVKTKGAFTIKNISDNNWSSEFSNLQTNETLSVDSKNNILSSNIVHDCLLNDHNLHWIRLVPEKNIFITNADATITFQFRVPRKVGFT